MMIKTSPNNRTSIQNRISKITNQTTKNIYRIIAQNIIRPSNVSNDMFVSRSGQVKINSLDSCRTLDSCDFIVF